MKSFLSPSERKELKSLKGDLINPIKVFVDEVYNDTVGDSRRFYSSKARQTKQKIKQVRNKTEEQMSAFAQKRDEQQKRRKTSVKRITIVLALVVLSGIIIVSLALSVRTNEVKAVQTTVDTQSRAYNEPAKETEDKGIRNPGFE